MNNTSDLIRKMKNKRHENERRSKYINSLFTRTLISVILVLVSMIFVNYSDKNLQTYKKYVFTESLAFNKFNNFYEKYMGKLSNNEIPNADEQMVFNEALTYRSIEKFLDGHVLEVGTNYLVPSIQSGIVVFNGEKEGYGNTLIIQGIDGVDIWYSLVNVHEISLYDYIESGSLLGESAGEDIVITLVKDGVFLDFEEYIQEI